ncbi:MAG: M20/M25/M40 family metallo-hydrolase [Saprospiraceae bacterium]|nr:M20/M25/M40 family metallo-hydrolase [Candidatus Opimibacter iunctus]
MSIRLLILCCLLSAQSFAQISQDSAAFFIKDIYRQTYTEMQAYKWLTTLTKDIGNRLAGSENSLKAIHWAKATMDTLGFDSVWLQPVMVPHWERGDKEQVLMIAKDVGATQLKAFALGNSPGTGNNGVRAEVVEVQSIEDLRALPDNAVDGKIVFFNRAMDLGQLSTFSAYGGAADQRTTGPVAAAEKGAIAVVIRSLSTRQDDFPHTGMTQLSDEIENIPSLALSTNDAVVLSNALKKGKVELYIRTTCKMLEDNMSYNVIGEIKGKTNPDEIILIGGHFDSWDVGEGAHDDGSGCMHSMEVLYRLHKMGYQPKHTLRCVFFINEENGLRGGKAYADSAIINNEYHMAAIESDAGGFTPQSFGCSAGALASLDTTMAHMNDFMELLEPYDLELKAGGGGADIGPLKPKTGVMIGLRPDSSRYFDYHHSDADVLENVHPRELASGAAALTSLVFLLDQYGIGK